MKGKKSDTKKMVLIVVALLAVAGLGYSLYEVYVTGAARSGVIVCPEDECFWTQHIHAYVPIEICGESFRLPIEKGSLENVHTHEEENTAHLHTVIPYDPQTQQPKNKTLLKLGTFFDSIGVPFDEETIDGKHTGDACPNGEAGTLKMFVNGVRSDAYREYIWWDRDVIFIVFDDRTPEEVGAELAANPIEFPSLGRG